MTLNYNGLKLHVGSLMLIPVYMSLILNNYFPIAMVYKRRH